MCVCVCLHVCVCEGSWPKSRKEKHKDSQLKTTDEAAKQTNHAEEVTAWVVLHHKLLTNVGHAVQPRPCYHQNITQCLVGACTFHTPADKLISILAYLRN